MNFEKIPKKYNEELFFWLAQDINSTEYQIHKLWKIYEWKDNFNWMVDAILNYEKSNYSSIKNHLWWPTWYVVPSEDFVKSRIKNLLITEEIKENKDYIKEKIFEIKEEIEKSVEYNFLNEEIQKIINEFETKWYELKNIDEKIKWNISLIFKILPRNEELWFFMKNLMANI